LSYNLAELDELKASDASMTAGEEEKSPELLSDAERGKDEDCTILDWLNTFYQPPPPHPSTKSLFLSLELEYIPSFEVAERISLNTLAKRTDDLRFETLSFINLSQFGLIYISNSNVYPYSGAIEWAGSLPFAVSESKIHGNGVFFRPSEKDIDVIPEDIVLFPYGGVIQQRSEHPGNFEFQNICFL
jgi:hypothetical protein